MERVAATTTCLLFLLYLTSAQQENCGFIGNNNETAAKPSRAQLFLLNTAHPAPCTGNVTSWRVCYYGPDSVNRAGSYWATYAVYRRTGSGSTTRYVRVSEIFRAIRTVAAFTITPDVDGEIAQGGFNCYTDSIDVGDSPLTIQDGDMLGACVFDPDGDILVENDIDLLIRLPLDVVGEASGESLSQMGTAGCSTDDIPSEIPTNQLSTLNSRRLHVYASIEVISTTTETASTPSTTTATVTSVATVPVTIATDPTTEAQTTTVIAANSLTSTVTIPSQTPNSTITTTESAPTTTDLSTTLDIEVLVGTMVPVFLIVLASSILLTFGIATIMLRCHCQKKYPGNDNNQQPPALQNKLEDKRTVVSIERGAIPNCDLPPSCACATPEISCGSESNQSVAAYNEAPVSICKDNHKLYILEADNIPNDARNSTLIPGSCQDQSPKHASSPCELKSSKEAPKEFNDSMIKSVIIEESSICTPSRDPHQYNSYERICIYEKIQHCDINLSSTAEIYTTPLSSAAAEKETTESASKYYNQSNSGYERVWGYEVIQHCDLKLEDLQKL